jgi:hypothetical protein
MIFGVCCSASCGSCGGAGCGDVQATVPAAPSPAVVQTLTAPVAVTTLTHPVRSNAIQIATLVWPIPPRVCWPWDSHRSAALAPVDVAAAAWGAERALPTRSAAAIPKRNAAGTRSPRRDVRAPIPRLPVFSREEGGTSCGNYKDNEVTVMKDARGISSSDADTGTLPRLAPQNNAQLITSRIERDT